MINEKTNVLVEKIKSDLKKSLSEPRYFHSIGVMNKAIELSKIYGVDEDEAALAGLTHDIAKEFPIDEYFKIAEKNHIEFDEIEMKNVALLHGKIGAFIVKEKYNLNENIQNAVKYHTTTDKNMNMLAKIVFVSDKIEDGRKSENYDIEYERKLAKKDIDDCIIIIIEENLKNLINRKKLIHPKGIETRNYLLMNKS